MSRLGLILGAEDLPVAELSAAALDGDLCTVDEQFAPVDMPLTSAHRALALSRLTSARLIAERASAAWVYGVLRHPPVRHELCVEASNRVHMSPSLRFTVREVVIEENEVRRIAGVPVTTPLRTIVDLARSAKRFTARERHIIGALMAMDSISLEQCQRTLDAIPHLPYKRRAYERIRDVVQRPVNRYPSVTRYTS